MELSAEKLTGKPELRKLVEELLAEPYAKENGFAQLTLDDLGRLIDENRDSIGYEEMQPDLAQQSYRQCVDLYCRILMELEKESELPVATLYELVNGNEGAGVIPIKNDSSLTGGIENVKDPLAAPRANDLTPISETAPQHDHLEADEEEQARVNERNMTPPRSAYENDFRLMMDRVGGKLTKDHLELALYFQMVKGGSFPFSPEHADRISAQSFCFALESEMAAKILPITRSFWPEREAAIRSIVDPHNPRFDLHPGLKGYLDAVAQSGSEGPAEWRIPAEAVLHALRYVLVTEEPEKFPPSLFEVGMLLFLFGQEKALEGLSLKNSLQIAGLDEKDLGELALRVSRVQQTRNDVFSVGFAVAEDNLERLQRDALKILDLFSQLHVDTVKREKRAA